MIQGRRATCTPSDRAVTAVLEAGLAAFMWAAALARVVTLRDDWMVTLRSPGSWRVLGLLCAGATALTLDVPAVSRLLDAGRPPETMSSLLTHLALLWLGAQVVAVVGDQGSAPDAGMPRLMVRVRYYAAICTVCGASLVTAFALGANEPFPVLESRTVEDSVRWLVSHSYVIVVVWACIETVRMSLLLRGSPGSGAYMPHVFITTGAATAAFYMLYKLVLFALSIEGNAPRWLIDGFSSVKAVCSVIFVIAIVLGLEAAGRPSLTLAVHWEAWRSQRNLRDLRNRLVGLLPQHAFPERSINPQRSLACTITEIHDCLMRMAPHESAHSVSQAEAVASSAYIRGSEVSPSMLSWAVRVELTRRSLAQHQDAEVEPAVRRQSNLFVDGGLANPANMTLNTQTWLALAVATREVDNILTTTTQGTRAA